MATLPSVSLDAYVIDVLMPDLIGHDRRPAAFVVYLYLLQAAQRGGNDRIGISLQTLATRTGLSKSAVQSAIRHLRRRGLLDDTLAATTSAPVRRVMHPWRR
jgi:hypothetical protein